MPSTTPLQDLLAGLPPDDRLREIIRVGLIKSSKGSEVQVVSRMTRPMVTAFEKSRLRVLFPHLSSTYWQEVALRDRSFRSGFGNVETDDLFEF